MRSRLLILIAVNFIATVFLSAFAASMTGLADGPRTIAHLGPEHVPVFVSGQEGYHTYRIPSLIATRKGTLLAFCEGRKKAAAAMPATSTCF